MPANKTRDLGSPSAMRDGLHAEEDRTK